MQALSSDALDAHLASITVKNHFRTWARTFACSPRAVFEPESVRDCQWVLELARRRGASVRVVGVGHSPSDVACTRDFMLSTRKLAKLVAVRHASHFGVA